MNANVKARTLVYLLIAVVLFPSIVRTNSGTSLGSNANAPVNIALVLAVGGLGDKGFNDAAYAGLFKSFTALSGGMNYNLTVPTSITSTNNLIESQASSTVPVYDLIVSIGMLSAAGINASAQIHPNMSFVIIDGKVDLPNVASVIFKEHEGS